MQENKALIDYFGEPSFDAESYARKLFEHEPIEVSLKKVRELEALKKGTEDDLQNELFNNYQLFICTLEEIQGMKNDMRQLKEFLEVSHNILSSFDSIHLTGWGTSGVEDAQQSDASLLHHSTRLPEWLLKSPAVLEELIIEQKNELACTLILRVRKFREGVSDLAHLTPGACETVATVEALGEELVQRLLGEISEVSSITPWGFCEHRRNFALLIELGHADAAAESFVAERTALIRRSLCMIEVTADPLTRVRVLSSTFFEQTADCVRAFLHLFCGPTRQRVLKTKTSDKSDEGTSSEYSKAIAGVRLCGTAPFYRLISWVDEELTQYAHLVGQQFLIVGASFARPAAGLDRTVKGLDKKFPIYLIGTIAFPIFEVVSTILNKVFKYAESLESLGLPVVPTLATRLSKYLAAFLNLYVECVEGNIDRHISEDSHAAEPFCSTSDTMEGLEMVAATVGPRLVDANLTLTSSGIMLVEEILYFMDLSALFLPSCQKSAELYLEPLSTELYPQIVECIVKLMNGFMIRFSETAEECSEEQVEVIAVCFNNLAEIFVPNIQQWFKEMRPWARSDEVTKLENVKQSCHEFSEEVRTILISDASTSSDNSRQSGSNGTENSNVNEDIES